MDIYEQLIKFKEEGIACMIVTVVDKMGEGPVTVGKKMLVTETAEAFGTVGGGAIEYEAREHCKTLIKSRNSDLITYSLNEGKIVENATNLPMACGGTAQLFFDYVGVKGYVYIFGGGHVGQALVRVLNTMDYHLTVIDHRKEVIDVFEGADVTYNQSFVSFIEEKGIRDGSYMIVCTPSHKYDYNVLDQVYERGLTPKYIGMLCSHVKLQDYLEKCYKKFGREIDLKNFYSPTGLDIGGGSPAEIAISIAAEMLAIEYDKKGHLHMRGHY